MKLIISYVTSDHSTYGFDQAVPIEYSSEEALYCDFIDKCEKSFKNYEACFYIEGNTFNVDDFIFHDFESGKLERDWPDILTIDEWFKETVNENNRWVR